MSTNEKLIKKIDRQAVVVIHGMGEQRPMDTLREFVSGVLKTLQEQNPTIEAGTTVRSKPDSVGDIYETVRLSMSGNRGRPVTDFYEFYWAHNMRDTKFSHTTSWLINLVRTRYKNIPDRLKSLYITVWSIIVIGVLAAVPVYYFCKSQFVSGWTALIPTIITATILPFFLSIIGGFFKSTFLSVAGDAARYFTPKPDNIGERSRIRQQGIAFLKKLHDLKEHEQVDRIIIVAHSLGSVVAYDLIRLLWEDYRKSHCSPLNVNQKALDNLDKYIKDVDANREEFDVDKFRALQSYAWHNQRCNGCNWAISDFITLGAAINAANYFIVSKVPYETLIDQRELPVCPPKRDPSNGIFAHHPSFYVVNGQKRSLNILHEGAPFAITRWTNIYYSSDFVGGPAHTVFGQGIIDKETKRKSPWIYPGGHTDYWNHDDELNKLAEIIYAMDLQNNALKTYEKKQAGND